MPHVPGRSQPVLREVLKGPRFSAGKRQADAAETAR